MIIIIILILIISTVSNNHKSYTSSNLNASNNSNNSNKGRERRVGANRCTPLQIAAVVVVDSSTRVLTRLTKASSALIQTFVYKCTGPRGASAEVALSCRVGYPIGPKCKVPLPRTNFARIATATVRVMQHRSSDVVIRATMAWRVLLTCYHEAIAFMEQTAEVIAS